MVIVSGYINITGCPRLSFLQLLFFLFKISLAVVVVSEMCKTKFRSHAVTVNTNDLKEKLNNIFNTSWIVKLHDEQSI